MSFADLANRATSLSPELRSYLEAVETHMYRDRDFQNESITRGEFSSKESRESAGK
jgi:hypothetical protein